MTDYVKQFNRVALTAVAIGMGVIALAIGCGPNTPVPTPPPPSIVVRRTETAGNKICITVSYSEHQYNSDNNNRITEFSATLTTTEAIAAYAKQVEFLMSQLEEVEKRMRIAEQTPDDGSVLNAQIVVELNGSLWAKVKYIGHGIEFNHSRLAGNYLNLTTIKQVMEYKKQVEFLLRMLEGARGSEPTPAPAKDEKK